MGKASLKGLIIGVLAGTDGELVTLAGIGGAVRMWHCSGGCKVARAADCRARIDCLSAWAP